MKTDFVEVNRAVSSIFGYSEQELLKLSMELHFRNFRDLECVLIRLKK
jgi:PAS domain S-box-containing protein